MPTVTADKVIDQNIYAKRSVKGYASDFKTVAKTFAPGNLIGKVYSWYIAPDGNLYWMIYLTTDDYIRFNPTYVKHDAADISLPALPDILEKISEEKDAKDLATKGVLQYNIDKYGKWIIGGIVVAIALPTVVRTLQTKKAIAGTNDKKALLLLLLLGGGIYLYSQDRKKKRKGSIEIGPLDKGEFLPDYTDADTLHEIYFDATKMVAGINNRPAVPLII